MSDASKSSGPATKIAGGIAVFIVSSIIQATMGDSSMFSMSYTSSGFLAGLLVNITFWPGWLFTLGLVGSGVLELIEPHDGSESEPKPWDVE